MYISPQGRYQIKKDPEGKTSYQTVPRYSVLELSIFNKLGWRDTSSPKSVKEVPSVKYDKVKYNFDKELGQWFLVEFTKQSKEKGSRLKVHHSKENIKNVSWISKR